MFADTHAHYDDEAFDEDRDESLLKAKAEGVKFIINAAQNLATSQKCIEMAEKYNFVYCAVGIHPHNADEFSEEAIEKLAGYAVRERVVAIGETGLDYHYNFSSHEQQKLNFTRHIRLAKELCKPIVVHDREAHEDVMSILLKEAPGSGMAVFHCYSGSAEMARVIADKGWYFSVGGAVTFKNARRIIEALAVIPAERLMLETDCPYMTPEPYRGRRNESPNIYFTARKIAEVIGVEYEKLCERTTENAERFFGILPKNAC